MRSGEESNCDEKLTYTAPPISQSHMYSMPPAEGTQTSFQYYYVPFTPPVLPPQETSAPPVPQSFYPSHQFWPPVTVDKHININKYVNINKDVDINKNMSISYSREKTPQPQSSSESGYKVFPTYTTSILINNEPRQTVQPPPTPQDTSKRICNGNCNQVAPQGHHSIPVSNNGASLSDPEQPPLVYISSPSHLHPAKPVPVPPDVPASSNYDMLFNINTPSVREDTGAQYPAINHQPVFTQDFKPHQHFMYDYSRPPIQQGQGHFSNQGYYLHYVPPPNPLPAGRYEIVYQSPYPAPVDNSNPQFIRDYSPPPIQQVQGHFSHHPQALHPNPLPAGRQEIVYQSPHPLPVNYSHPRFIQDYSPKPIPRGQSYFPNQFHFSNQDHPSYPLPTTHPNPVSTGYHEFVHQNPHILPAKDFTTSKVIVEGGSPVRSDSPDTLYDHRHQKLPHRAEVEYKLVPVRSQIIEQPLFYPASSNFGEKDRPIVPHQEQTGPKVSYVDSVSNSTGQFEASRAQSAYKLEN